MTNDKALPTLTDALPELTYKCASCHLRMHERKKDGAVICWTAGCRQMGIAIGRAATTREAGDDREGMIYAVAVVLARQEGCDDPHHLIWEGGPVPEPWGEVWQKYESDAAEIVDALATPPSASAIVEGAADE